MYDASSPSILAPRRARTTTVPVPQYDGRDCIYTVSYGAAIISLRCGLLTREPNAVPAPERPYF